jgi:RNA polymerase sigma factor (sigma-70 family)
MVGVPDDPKRQEWEQAYLDLLPLFSSILVRLAKQGFAHRAGEGLDVVHDFFLQRWPAVKRGFDGERGTLSAYAGTAFVRFARQRLAADARYRALLDEPSNDLPAAPESTDPYDLRALTDALERLSPADRELLCTRFGAVNPSERELAEQRSESRHTVRQELAAALTRLVLSLQDRQLLSASDSAVAHALFVQGLSTKQAAAVTGQTVQRVRALRTKLLKNVCGA